jgi:hypothetical protein
VDNDNGNNSDKSREETPPPLPAMLLHTSAEGPASMNTIKLSKIARFEGKIIVTGSNQLSVGFLIVSK